MDDFSGPGKCQVCTSVMVDKTEKGLQCKNRGHWVCWGCMVGAVHWREVIKANPSLFDLTTINSNLRP